MKKILVTMILSAVANLLGFATQAQTPSGPAPAGGMAGGMPPTGPLTVHQLTPSVYWVEGGVGNVGIIVGESGVVVVDATISTKSAQELLSDVAKITPKPVKAVVLTHGDIDHVAGLGAFPAGIAIYAQKNTQQRMQAGIAAGRSAVPADHAPNHAVDKHETVDVGGMKVELFYWAPAHTDGDLVVYVPSQKVVFTGDIFALDQPRALIHAEQNGTSAGWVTTAKGMLALNADRFVVGHGEVQGKAALQKRVDLVVDEIASIKKLVAKGESLDKIQAAVDDPPKGFVPAAGGPRFEPFSKVVYDELTNKH